MLHAFDDQQALINHPDVDLVVVLAGESVGNTIEKATRGVFGKTASEHLQKLLGDL